MADETPLQLRMKILQIRMDYLSVPDRTRDEEELLLGDLDKTVRRLKEIEMAEAKAEADSLSSIRGAERRTEGRAPASFPVILRLIRADGKSHSNITITRDIAIHGISLVAAFEAKAGEKVALEVGLSATVRLTDVKSEVRWCTPIWTHPGHYLIGLRFLELSPAARKALERFGY